MSTERTARYYGDGRSGTRRLPEPRKRQHLRKCGVAVSVAGLVLLTLAGVAWFPQVPGALALSAFALSLCASLA